MNFNLASYRDRLAQLAKQGIYIGTTSWKNSEWLGLVYDEQRYLTRGKFSEAKFERECLAEYAETFHSICDDSEYYRFPIREKLEELSGQVPASFRFTIKVTGGITIKKFPRLPIFGRRAGTMNANFLNLETFRERFIAPCEGIRSKAGPLIFEFSKFRRDEFEHQGDFLAALDRFLAALPRAWEYAVEIRNKKWLNSDYFQMLRSHGVAHVFNSWTQMPPVSEQLAMAESETASFSVARFLLKPGKTFAKAVKELQPYTAIKEPDEEDRGAAGEILKRSREHGRRAYIYVGNRLEGCAPLTIERMLDLTPPMPASGDA